MKPGDLAGTRTLMRLMLRRDRFLLPMWVLLPLLMAQGQVSFVTGLPDLEGFLTEMAASPVTGAMLGPVVPFSAAGAVMWRTAVQGVLVLGLASLLTVIRHTRTDEEAGRSELIRGGAVGRSAHLTAAMAVTCSASLAAGLLAALGLVNKGLDAGGALLFGLTIAAAGWFFAGIGALAAQLREHAGGARGIALAVLGVTWLPMVLNNLGGGYTWWAWLTPWAWYRVTQPFAGNHAWTVLYFVAASAVPVAAAFALSGRRDLGSGLLKPRLGPVEAAPGLRTPLALAWRLHKGAIVGWTVGLVFLGGTMGAAAHRLSSNLGLPDYLASMSSQEAFLSVMIYIMALLAGGTIYAMLGVLRLRTEENEGLAELILTRPVSRARWMSSHLAMALGGGAFLLLALGVAVGLAYGLAIGDLAGAWPLALGMSMSKIPVVWVMVGVTTLLYGLVPRAAAGLSWGYLGLLVVIEMAWEFQVVDWSVMRLTPLAYAHYSIPMADLPLLPLVWLTCLAALLIGAGMLSLRRRSIG